MTRKQGIRTAIFLVLTVVTLYLLTYLVGMDNTVLNSSRQQGYYMQPANTLDGIIIGRSMVDTDWVAPLAWNEKGITIYPLSSNDQPFCITSYLIEEVKKKHSPKLFIVDVHGIRGQALEDIKPGLRVSVNNMPLSINKINLIRNASSWDKEYYEYYNENGETLQNNSIVSDLSYYWSFMNNHARWEVLLTKSEKKRELTLASSLLSSGKNNYQEIKESKPTPPSDSEWDSYAASIFTEFLDYCQENDLPVLFVSLPTIEEDEADYMQFNAALEMANERNFPTLNLNTSEKYEELGLDFESDFGDKEHLNSKGAMKVTEYLTEYLAEHYDFPDKRGDAAYAHWDEGWSLFLQEFEEGWG